MKYLAGLCFVRPKAEFSCEGMKGWGTTVVCSRQDDTIRREERERERGETRRREWWYESRNERLVVFG